MRYLIAYDYDPENPNPHAWQVDFESMRFASFEEVVYFAEREDERMVREEDYTEDELPRWIVVAVRD